MHFSLALVGDTYHAVVIIRAAGIIMMMLPRE